jgi:sodium/proline symporter
MTNWGALFGMIVGAVTVIVWKNVGLGERLYEIVPGFVFNLIVAYIVSLITYKKNDIIEKEFDESVSLLKKK